jgi:ribosomal protein S17
MTLNGASPDDRGFRKTREGIVVSDKMDKTVTVEVMDRVKHGLYSKVMSRSRKFKAHDEANAAGEATVYASWKLDQSRQPSVGV